MIGGGGGGSEESGESVLDLPGGQLWLGLNRIGRRGDGRLPVVARLDPTVP